MAIRAPHRRFARESVVQAGQVRFRCRSFLGGKSAGVDGGDIETVDVHVVAMRMTIEPHLALEERTRPVAAPEQGPSSTGTMAVQQTECC